MSSLSVSEEWSRIDYIHQNHMKVLEILSKRIRSKNLWNLMWKKERHLNSSIFMFLIHRWMTMNMCSIIWRYAEVIVSSPWSIFFLIWMSSSYERLLSGCIYDEFKRDRDGRQVKISIYLTTLFLLFVHTFYFVRVYINK